MGFGKRSGERWFHVTDKAIESLFFWVWKANDEVARRAVCPFIFGPKSFQAENAQDAARKGAAAGISGRVAVLNPFTCEVSFFEVSVMTTVGALELPNRQLTEAEASARGAGRVG
jgi:hypothetical protein